MNTSSMIPFVAMFALDHQPMSMRSAAEAVEGSIAMMTEVGVQGRVCCAEGSISCQQGGGCD